MIRRTLIISTCTRRLRIKVRMPDATAMKRYIRSLTKSGYKVTVKGLRR